MEKSRIREEMRRRRGELNDREISAAAAGMERVLTGLAAYRRARAVFCYRSFGGELSTRDLIARMLAEGKRVCVPCIRGGSMEAGEVTAGTVYVPGSFGIGRPEAWVAVPKPEIDLALVPGLAFCGDGARVGMGGGYYDRYLADFTGRKIGLCYDFQIVDKLEQDSHDVKMDGVVTPSRAFGV